MEILLGVKACVPPVSSSPSCLSNTTCALSVCFSLCHVQWLTDTACLSSRTFLLSPLKNLLSHLLIRVYEEGVRVTAHVWR